jgi:phosphatidylglycerol:prolipoprotein diacylglycerol transferase
MYPVLVEIAGVKLHGYGVAIATALLLALWLAGREAQRKGLEPAVVDQLALPIVLWGLLGGRLGYVVGWEPDLLWRDPLDVLAVWRGGLALHGGLVAGFGAAIWLCRRRRFRVWRLADTVAPALALGQAVGRLGCFLSGDSYGTPTDAPWAVTFTNPAALAPLGVPLHPVQLYEAGLDLVLLGVLWATRRQPAFEGRQFLLWAGGYALIRIFTETFRGDRVELALGLSLLQGVSVTILWAALAAGAVLSARRPPAGRRPAA